jgi:hypothetical protein
METVKKIAAGNFLSGKKTYIVGLLMIVTALAPLIDGGSIDQTLLMEGLGLMTLRKGIDNA